MSIKTKGQSIGRRYSDDEKKEIVEFARNHDAAHGRGGKSAAVKKFGISPISLATWIGNTGKPLAAGKKRGRKPGSKNVSKPISGGGKYTAKLKELTDVATQIDKAESHLDNLLKKFEDLKASL
jgi:transposase-like protein